MTYFLIGLYAILVVLLSSMLFGLRLGAFEYFRIKNGESGNNHRSVFKRNIVSQTLLDLFTNLFYNRIITTILAVIFYPLKAWSRNIVYNYFFKYGFTIHGYNKDGSRLYNQITNKPKLYKLKNDKFRNGFYAMPRPKEASVSSKYKSKNMIVGFRDDFISNILFPIAFMIWLYNNDRNPYDMLVNQICRYDSIPSFLHKYLKTGEDKGSYLEVGDNLIKQPAFGSFIIDSLFASKCKDINIRLFYDN